MVGADYEFAIKQYEALTSRFPFTDQARQARLDLIYAYYRKGQKESATDAADEFLRENPTHPRVDYAWYMKGMIDFERTPNAIERCFGVDMAKRPPGSSCSSPSPPSSTVVKQYPKSDYAHDALRRMIYLRNRLAEYEVNVARYYIKRGAYLAAAAARAERDRAVRWRPGRCRGAAHLAYCYEQLGLNDLAAITSQRVYAGQLPDWRSAWNRHRHRKHVHWWKLWMSGRGPAALSADSRW